MIALNRSFGETVDGPTRAELSSVALRPSGVVPRAPSRSNRGNVEDE